MANATTPCAVCRKPFRRRANAKYCSDRCRAIRARERNQVRWASQGRIPCDECGEPTGWRDTPAHRKRSPNPICNPCRRARPGYRPSRLAARGVTETHLCERCKEQWTRIATKGQRPRYCPGCRVDYRRWIPVAVRRGVYERDGWVCQICLESVDESLIGSTSPWRPSLDHVVPRSEGGSDDPDNLRLSHFWCNGVLNDGRSYSDDDFRISA